MLGLHCCTDFSLAVTSRDYSPAAGHRLPIAAASLVVKHMGSRARGLRSCGSRALVAPRHVGSSQTRDRTHVSGRRGRRILYQ